MTPEAWSAEHPIGTEMLYHPVRCDMHAERVKVRSDAWRLGHGAVVVKVTGRAGGVLIEHLQAFPPRTGRDDDA